MNTKPRTVEFGRNNVLSLITSSQLARVILDFATAKIGFTRKAVTKIDNHDIGKPEAVASAFGCPLMSLRDTGDMWGLLLKDEAENCCITIMDDCRRMEHA